MRTAESINDESNAERHLTFPAGPNYLSQRMPTIFSHAIFAAAIGKAFAVKAMPVRFWVLTAACAIIPDVDVVGFAFGIRYGSMLGHRGITHSLIFAILVGVIVGIFGFRRVKTESWKLILYFALVTFSHALLDMLTNGGLGVAVFAPFSETRYFFPWRPLEVSPIGIRFFSENGLAVMLSEIVWIWLPSVILFLAAWVIRRRFRYRIEG